jgi:hypothetical protein
METGGCRCDQTCLTFSNLLVLKERYAPKWPKSIAVLYNSHSRNPSLLQNCTYLQTHKTHKTSSQRRRKSTRQKSNPRLICTSIALPISRGRFPKYQNPTSATICIIIEQGHELASQSSTPSFSSREKGSSRLVMRFFISKQKSILALCKRASTPPSAPTRMKPPFPQTN